MYTTPRKVKQESRLRRSLSLTNTTGLGPTTRPNGCSTEGDLVDLGDNCEDLLLNCNSLPPPYRLPPPASNTTEFSPENSNQIYQTHSSKFPIIRETTYADPNSNSVKFGPVKTEFYTKIQPKSVKQAWADGRNKSFTLERPSARERLISQQEALVRRSSLDLERFLQAFNEDRPLMASIQQQQGHLNGSLGGIDNPGLDLGQVYSINGQKMASYYPESTSTTSLSLSSSNTDSVDTVIYKTGSSPSIRDWQRFSEANANQTSDFNHRTTENNSYRDSNLFDSRTYQIQQQQLQQQQQQQFNSSNYTIEYRNAQIQQQILQNQNQNQVNLSGVQSTGQNSTCNNNHNNNGSISTTSSNINNNGISLRNPQTQQPGAGYTGLMGNTGSTSTTTTANTIGSSKSPMLPMKFSTPSSSNTPGLTLEAQQVQDKNSKESSKIFQTKYNHIKDMISSRFGNSQQQHQQHQQPNNKVIQNPSEVSRNLNNSSATATTTVQQQVNGQFDYNGNHQGQNYGNQNGVGYYSRPATGNIGTSPGHQNGLGYANKSPLLSDNKKSINTSFRKAIQKSTQKSNLVEDSLQMRSIPDIQQQQQHQQQLNYRQVQFTQQDHQMIKQQQLKQQQQQQYQLQQNEQQMQHAERAQRALDKLCELQGQPGQGTQQGQVQGQGQFNRVGSLGQPGNYMRNQGGFAYPDVQMGYTNGQLGPEKVQQQQQISYNGGERHRFSVKPNGPSPSSISLNSSQMNGPSSILHQPVFKPSMKLISPHDNEAFDTGNDPPPPLPTSQKPSIIHNSSSQNVVHHDEIGLPILSLIEKRENGDGSTGSTESSGGKNIIEAGSSGGKLKQITENMQNLALSVSSSGNVGGECHLSSSSECEKSCQRVGSGQSHTTTDSGHGTAHMTTKSPQNSDPSNSDPLESMAKMRQFGDHIGDSISSGNDSENWVDIEPEIRQILEMERIGKSSSKGGNLRSSSGILYMHPPSDVQQQQQNMLQNEKSAEMNEMTISQSILHPPQSSSGGKQQHNTSPNSSPKLTKKYDLNSYNKKPSQELAGCSRDQPVPSTSGNNPSSKSGKQQQQGQQSRPSILRSNSGSGGQQQQQQQQGQGQQQLSQQQQRLWSSRQRITEGLKSKSSSKNPLKSGKLSRNAMSQILYSLQDDMNGDMTSTTTGLDLESMLDQTECTSDDDDLSTTIDTTDAHAIRRQLESLESMYTEVLKVLGAKKFQGNRFPNSTDLRSLKRRPYGSMSSLPSSVSSRPFRDKKIGKLDDKKKVKDLKSINRRFQRLESHVVTLARSVAHLSSEMRTQHLMVQEMDSIRNELSQLKSQIMKSTLQFQSQNQSGSNQNQNSSTRMSKNGVTFAHGTDWTTFRNALPSLTNPCRVRKLTKFFGDEPPLVRIFLKKLGYEKYATAFELERIGIMELPYLTEERLSKMGIPMGPRLRILQEAQVCLKPGGYIGSHQDSHHNTNHTSGNLSVYVV